MKSTNRLLLIVEIGDAHVNRRFRNNDLAVSDQHAAQPDIEVFAGGAAQLKYAVRLQRQHLPYRELPPVQLYFYVERNVAESSNLFSQVHVFSEAGST